jgi:hypothetical protein
LNEKVKSFKNAFSGEKPDIRLRKMNNEIELTLKCRDATKLIGFHIGTIDERQYCLKYKVAYLERINLTAIFKAKEAEFLPIDKLCFHNKRWCVEGKPIPSDVSFITMACLDDRGKYTPLSDIISFK